MGKKRKTPKKASQVSTNFLAVSGDFCVWPLALSFALVSLPFLQTKSLMKSGCPHLDLGSYEWTPRLSFPDESSRESFKAGMLCPDNPPFCVFVCLFVLFVCVLFLERKTCLIPLILCCFHFSGLLQLWGFNHEDSLAHFGDCLSLLPSDAACLKALVYVLSAFCLSPNYNNPMGLSLEKASEFIASAKQIANEATLPDWVAAFVAASEKRVLPLEETTVCFLFFLCILFSWSLCVLGNAYTFLLFQGNRNVAYAKAMTELIERFPNLPPDVYCLYLESIMNKRPWALWSTFKERREAREQGNPPPTIHPETQVFLSFLFLFYCFFFFLLSFCFLYSVCKSLVRLVFPFLTPTSSFSKSFFAITFTTQPGVNHTPASSILTSISGSSPPPPKKASLLPISFQIFPLIKVLSLSALVLFL